MIFTSDNGPTYLDQVDYEYFNSTGIFVNSSNSMKGSLREGGLRVPMIVNWPNEIKGNSVSNHISVFYDFVWEFRASWNYVFLIVLRP